MRQRRSVVGVNDMRAVWRTKPEVAGNAAIASARNGFAFTNVNNLSLGTFASYEAFPKPVKEKG